MLPMAMTLTIVALAGLGIFLSSRKLGGMRKDGRPHQVPWGLVMVGCTLVLFMAVVHFINLAGFETGPEHGFFGRMR